MTFVELRESGQLFESRGGGVRVKLVSPGWSENDRYYPADVLERDGAAAFPSGTHMYWNHPTATEAAERPERDLRDLAAVLLTAARYDAHGSAGPGLYAPATVFPDFRERLQSMGPHLGVSIRASGRGAQGEVGGRVGFVVEGLEASPNPAAHTVDFVTAGAAGGLVLAESAGRRTTAMTDSGRQRLAALDAAFDRHQGRGSNKYLAAGMAVDDVFVGLDEARRTTLVHGLAERHAKQAEFVEENLIEAFLVIGLSESGARSAAKGRR